MKILKSSLPFSTVKTAFLVVLTLSSTFVQAQVPFPTNTIPQGFPTSTVPMNPSVPSATPSMQSDNIQPRQYTLDQRTKAREDSVRMLRANTQEPGTAEQKIKIFGADIFSNKSLDIAPITNIPTPKGYILGPGDEVVINIYGDQYKDFDFKKTVTPEGVLQLEQVGPVFVSGLSIEAATSRLRAKLSRIYLSDGEWK
ncbi:polysaccharide biosynthesis/export family protein [Siphonobacter sp. SORGH_AS_0500]|uniref:polysaccharide biosynthesis/export family protein n=1 Tax=Siphonobacter sp. SORGH_AS_0500 TaxID=1864824 RepID=UPI0012FEF967|nr:polysaccharide biosynthesis/export family protein [Siphonobacter sp. SORGH_AS_0500]